MTSGADANDLGVVHRKRRYPAIGRMAIDTGIGGVDMGGIFAGCRRAVMTTVTGTDDFCMVDCGDRFPGIGCMAIDTGISGVDMGGVFAGSVGAVMAAGTRAGHRIVIEGHRGPVGRGMTAVALRRRLYVSR